MAVRLDAEHDYKNLKDATRKALTAASPMGGDVLVAGSDVGVETCNWQLGHFQVSSSIFHCSPLLMSNS